MASVYLHKNDKGIKSTCCYCGVGCGVIVDKNKNGGISVAGDSLHPVNRGLLCSKGQNLHYTVNDRSDRLLYPQMRYNKNMPLQRVSWDAAMERAAAVFKTFIEKHGPDSVAFYASGQCLSEEYYVLNKLMKGFIGSNNIDTNSRLCMSSAVAAYKIALGEDIVPICYDDIELADCLFVAGGNPAWCHPILWRRVEAHKTLNPHVKIVVVDPRATDSCAIADLHLQLLPGTDVTLNHAIGRLLIENGHIDPEFIVSHTEGFAQYKTTVFQKTLPEAAGICGLAESDIRLAARYIGESKAFLTMWTMGLNQSATGVQKNLSLINLNLITGQIGKPGSGPFSLTGQPNAMGGREVGGLSNLLPAHRDLKNPKHREEVQKFWKGGAINPNPGLTATEMFEALSDGRLKAIWITGTNPLVSLPNVKQAEEALKKAKFVVVQDISNKPETLAYADLILPAAAWGEKEGTMTNSERRISFLNKIISPPGEALPDAEITCRFARQMGYAGFEYANAAAIYQEHARLTAKTKIDISGLSHEILKLKTVQWPFRSRSSQQGTKRIFTDKQFYTPSSKAQISAVPDDLNSERPDADYPFILTTGRIRDHWHTRSKTGKVNRLNQHVKQSYLEIHPDDADKLGIKAGDMTWITSRRGEVIVEAKLSAQMRSGVVFLPMHWGKISNSDLNRANNLTSDIVDPISGEPDFKYCAVKVQKYSKPIQRIVVVGAGAGAYAFVKSYRELNAGDEITVFSKEIFPFYNRVMLPDYISGERHWDELVNMDATEAEGYNIKLLRGISVEKIDRKNKAVIDSRGFVTPYDVLVLATGSSASLPKGVPALPGIFTMRNRMDADSFKKHLPSNGRVAIVGGGLLGLEMAAALREIGIQITIIQRTSRFLNRQLDPLGSQLLQDEMADQGCDIFYNEEVELYYGRSKLSGISLNSGHKINCDAVILAVGTTPNLGIARSCGLDCRRGVVINERLQTSDPHIYAIGEIAEFEGSLYGFTAAAEQQAELLARYLNGDVSSYYSGSVPMNIIKIHGFDLCSIGLTDCPDQHEYEEVIFIDKAKRYYKKCIIYQDKLVGCILIGDKSEFQEFKSLINNKTELSERRIQLLRSGAPADPVLGKLVCSCNNVGSENILNMVSASCATLKDLCAASGAGTGCGSCRPEVKRLMEEKLKDLVTLAV